MECKMDTRQVVINKLNELVGNDSKNITYKCEEYERILKETRFLKNNLSLASSEVPLKVGVALKDVDDVTQRINECILEFDNLNVNAKCQLSKVKDLVSVLEKYLEKIEYLERSLSYSEILKIIQSINEGLEQSVLENDDEKSITSYISLCSYMKTLQHSKCNHLFAYVRETEHFWHNLLSETFSNEFEEVLKCIKWPFIQNSMLFTPSPEMLQKLQLFAEYLFKIQFTENSIKMPEVKSAFLPDFVPLTLPMTLMVRPLRKRFLFHFYGSKQTNRSDKPEWFFTLVLTWIRDHENFVQQWIQPVLNKVGQHSISAKTELMRGLVHVVVEKLHSELPQLQFDDALFSHTVDETLSFDRELRSCYGYPPSEPSVIGVLTQAAIFIKWINMERKYAREKMDLILSSDTAWNTLGSADIDDLRITECGDSFLTLLMTITDRYQPLPQPGHRLQFLELQLELIDDFRVRLLQLLHEQPSDPFSSHLPSILNTVNYISTVLEEWGTLNHFLQLQYYKSQFANASIDFEFFNNSDSCELTCTVFDEILSLLLPMKMDLVNNLCEIAILEVKARSREYRREKWFSMPSPQDQVSPSLIPSICSMLQILSSKLHQLEKLLAAPLFTLSWQILSKNLDIFIYEEVILQNQFNEGGAFQLQYDIVRNMFPIFGQFTLKPEIFFPNVKDSCTLLNIAKGSAILLKEVLINSVGTDALNEIGVTNLSSNAALAILSLRLDLSKL